MTTAHDLLRQALQPSAIVRCQHNLVDRLNGRLVSRRQYAAIKRDVRSYKRLLRLVQRGLIAVPAKEQVP